MKTHVTINKVKIQIPENQFNNSSEALINMLLALDGLTFTPIEAELSFNLKEWRKNLGEENNYLFLNDTGKERSLYWRNDEFDNYNRSIGNIFPTTEQGKELLQAYKAKLIEDNK